jgi:hypothetical protein
MFKKAIVLTRPTLARRDAPYPRRGRSKRRGDAYSLPYVEPLSAARTKLADFFNILLSKSGLNRSKIPIRHAVEADLSQQLRPPSFQ